MLWKLLLGVGAVYVLWVPILIIIGLLNRWIRGPLTADELRAFRERQQRYNSRTNTHKRVKTTKSGGPLCGSHAIEAMLLGEHAMNPLARKAARKARDTIFG